MAVGAIRTYPFGGHRWPGDERGVRPGRHPEGRGFLGDCVSTKDRAGPSSPSFTEMLAACGNNPASAPTATSRSSRFRPCSVGASSAMPSCRGSRDGSAGNHDHDPGVPASWRCFGPRQGGLRTTCADLCAGPVSRRRPGRGWLARFGSALPSDWTRGLHSHGNHANSAAGPIRMANGTADGAGR